MAADVCDILRAFATCISVFVATVVRVLTFLRNVCMCVRACAYVRTDTYVRARVRVYMYSAVRAARDLKIVRGTSLG